MLEIDQAPQKGSFYATFIDKVIFQKYQSLSEIMPLIKEDGMLELHFFDSEKELRFLKTRSQGIKVYDITDSCSHDDVYEEVLYVSSENVDKHTDLSRQIAVVNYLQYDSNDMIRIVNYRLKEVN